MKHAVAILLAVTGACAGNPAPGALQPTPAQRTQAGGAHLNRDVITEADIAADPALKAQSVLQLIRVLRPHFLTDRGTSGITSQDERGNTYGDPEAGKVHVSIDNGRIESLSALESLHASNVVEIRFLSVAQAMQKFGSMSRQGPVIFVKTAK